MPYSPMGQTICTTTPEQMRAKLAQRVQQVTAKALKADEQLDVATGEITHVQHESQPLVRGPDGVADVVGAGPPARLLTWCKPERGATGVRTTCGRFSCAKVTVNGTAQYELWRLTPGSEWFKLIGAQLQSFAIAQDLAEQCLRTKP
ncbi:MAG: hypothetical protein JWO52_3335 [Gammaproteobacteria bacterium]|nr:hypothetical protein [Gammaproteobacteria bacterium]